MILTFEKAQYNILMIHPYEGNTLITLKELETFLQTELKETGRPFSFDEQDELEFYIVNTNTGELTRIEDSMVKTSLSLSLIHVKGLNDENNG